MIKKIVVSGKGSTNMQFWGLGLTVPVDGVWTEQWLVGSNVKTVTNNTYICDEFTATTTKPCYGSNNNFWLSSLFTAGTNKYMTFAKSSTFDLTITFTESIAAIKNVIYRFYPGSSNYINRFKAYDENDILLFSSDTTWTPSTSTNTPLTGYLETPDLQTIKIYPTNKLGTIETTDACHITDIYSIDIINPTQVLADNTDVRYLLSFDGRQTYKSYDTTTGAWITVNTTDIMAQGLTSSELLALTSSEYLLAIDTSYRTLDILVGLITTDETRTPCINSIRVSYYKITT